jgi:hypothetical protein
MLDFTQEISINEFLNNNKYESLLEPLENNLFKDSDNISMIFERNFPFHMNEDDANQNFPEIQKEITPEQNPFISEFKFEDANDKVENKYLETSMVLNEINDDNMKINVETKMKIFNITKERKFNKKCLPSYPRIDDYKIYWRTKINKYIFEVLNELIEKSDLPKDLKKIIHTPSYKKFTINVNRGSTYGDLSKTISEILIIGHETQKNQKQNFENIQAIYAYNLNYPTQSTQKIINFLNKTYEQIIEEFYNPQNERYNELCMDDTAKFHDEEFKKQKGFSLFEKNALINLFKQFKKNKQGNEKNIGRKRAPQKMNF